ncbi:hypothetical protein FQA39_LY04822 [Lamprigera yunnana]|nr:hypothetical protein FQA39_LY04822 [Lamprigera yunnana]
MNNINQHQDGVPFIAYNMLVEAEKRNFLRLHRRQLRDSNNPFNMRDEDFKVNFRLTKDITIYIINKLIPRM